jgi:hypothetical protein
MPYVSGFESIGPNHSWPALIVAQARLRVLDVGVVLLYGKDLRTGNNAFYTDVVW